MNVKLIHNPTTGASHRARRKIERKIVNRERKRILRSRMGGRRCSVIVNRSKAGALGCTGKSPS